VHSRFFLCQCAEEEPRALGCAEFRWVDESELREFKFPPADEPVVAKLLAERQWWQNQKQTPVT